MKVFEEHVTIEHEGKQYVFTASGNVYIRPKPERAKEQIAKYIPPEVEEKFRQYISRPEEERSGH